MPIAGAPRTASVRIAVGHLLRALAAQPALLDGQRALVEDQQRAVLVAQRLDRLGHRAGE